MKNKYYLGIDTSCYTTSIAVIDQHRNIIKDERIILSVDRGKKGLRQSEAFFQHVKNIPVLYKKALEGIEIDQIVSVTATDRPRNVTESYMPVFTSGVNFASVISSTLNIGINNLSHQENHIFSCLIDKDLKAYEKFNAIHISGGTTEILEVNRRHSELEINELGKTLDLSFGQLVDRIGIKLGFDFPCGKEMDQFISSTSCDLSTLDFCLSLKQSIKNTDFNISGIENKLINFYDSHSSEKFIKEFIVYQLFTYLGELLQKLIIKASQVNHYKTYLIVGGVASNTIIRALVANNKKMSDYNITFGSPVLSSDNAIGNSYYGSLLGRQN